MALIDKIHLTGKKPKAGEEEEKEKEDILVRTKTDIGETSGKIIEEEEQKEDAVSLSIYKNYISALGGAKFIILYSLVMISWTFFNIAADWSLGLWAQYGTSNYNYLIINAIFGLASVICIVFRVILTFIYTIRASRRLHNDMLKQILNAPVNTFFDTVPIGRIINRLSADLNCCDAELPFDIGNMQMSLWRLLGSLLLCVFLIYWCILPIPFIVFASWYYLKKYLQLQRKLRRLGKASRSPVFQFAGECYLGASTIRAYKAQSKCNE